MDDLFAAFGRQIMASGCRAAHRSIVGASLWMPAAMMGHSLRIRFARTSRPEGSGPIPPADQTKTKLGCLAMGLSAIFVAKNQGGKNQRNGPCRPISSAPIAQDQKSGLLSNIPSPIRNSARVRGSGPWVCPEPQSKSPWPTWPVTYDA